MPAHAKAAGLLVVCMLAAMTACGPEEHAPASSLKAECDIQHGPCTRPLAGGSATLDIFPKPVRAMTDLKFRLILSGLSEPETASMQQPMIDLDMPDMFMGYNRVYLKQETPGVFSGAGVIVRCPSGIPTWKAVVTVPGIGEAVFVFDVLY